jgi:prepilin-type N-terminal cleavage/methylation domain-containing protein/prepilin-type processing-associated H-X9-DG protein
MTRRAFSMVELFVVMAVIGLLMAMVLPAVQAAREAGRRTQCLSNLRQIGLATHQYEEVHRMYPGWRQSGLGRPVIAGQPPPADLRMNNCSIQSQLLPYLDQAALFEELNLSRSCIPDEDDSTAPEWDMLATASQRRVAIFVCPSDGGDLSPGNNYRAYIGSGPEYKFSAEFFDSGDGFFSPLYDQPGGSFPIRNSTISDGLGQTAMFCERLRGSGDMKRFDPRRDASAAPAPPPATAGPTIANCHVLHELAVQGRVGWNPWIGRSWAVTTLTQTLYNHVMPPNSALADCGGDGDWAGAMTARSSHLGGVHVLFGDGSARFVADSIDLGVWRSLGTRNGGETILVGSY